MRGKSRYDQVIEEIDKKIQQKLIEETLKSIERYVKLIGLINLYKFMVEEYNVRKNKKDEVSEELIGAYELIWGWVAEELSDLIEELIESSDNHLREKIMEILKRKKKDIQAKDLFTLNRIL